MSISESQNTIASWAKRNPAGIGKASMNGQPTVFVSSAFRELSLAALKGAPLSVYLAYKSFADKHGIAWPSLPRLAKVTGYGINALKRARAALVEMGLLEPIEQDRKSGQFGRKKFQVLTVAPKQCYGTEVSKQYRTVAPKGCSTAAPKGCQEGFPSEGFPKEGSPLEAEGSAAAFCEPDLEGGVSPLQTTPEEKSSGLEREEWEAIGIKSHGPQRYRDGWVKAYQQHRAKTPNAKLSDVMEQFIRDCENQQIKIPHPFYLAKRAIEAAETRQTSTPAAGSDGKGKFDDVPVY